MNLKRKYLFWGIPFLFLIVSLHIIKSPQYVCGPVNKEIGNSTYVIASDTQVHLDSLRVSAYNFRIIKKSGETSLYCSATLSFIDNDNPSQEEKITRVITGDSIDFSGKTFQVVWVNKDTIALNIISKNNSQ